MVKINVGDNLRQLRRQQGITQEQLAEMSDVSLNFVSLNFKNKLATKLK